MSMNKKNRSLINTRYEAKKIYFQRKTINFIEKRNDELKKENQQLKDRINKAQKYLKDNRNTCFFDKDINYLSKILKGE